MALPTVNKVRGRPKAELTRADKAFLRAYAVTGDRKYAEMEAGLPLGGGVRILNRSDVSAKILEIGRTRLKTEGVPMALNALLSIVSDDKVNPMSRVAASKLILDHAYNPEFAEAEKKIDEMSLEEIDRQIERMQVVAKNGERLLDEDEEEDDVVGISDLAFEIRDDVEDAVLASQDDDD